jgi:hypothetical protein
MRCNSKNILNLIYNILQPNMTAQLVGVCDVIPSQYAAGCKQFFTTDSQAVTHMAQAAVQWVADKVPLAHCQVGPQQKAIVSGA